MDKISVIIPVYHVENYLDACVQSVVDQTYENLEIWLVDDGGGDACGAMCDAWAEKDARIHVIHQENRGLSGARNAALDRFTGAYVTFVDSDDGVAPDYVETLYRLIREYRVTVSQCNSVVLKDEAYGRKHETSLPEGCRTVPTMFEKRKAFSEGVMGSSAFLQTDFYHDMAWAALYHRDLFSEIRYPQGKIHEDIAVTYRIVYEAGSVAYTERPLYISSMGREGDINGSGRYYPARLDILPFRRERVLYFMGKGELALVAKEQRDYAVSLLTHYGKVKKILKDRELANKLRADYRRDYPLFKHADGLSGKMKLLLACCRICPMLWTWLSSGE